METIIFEVQGSGDSIYEVKFIKRSETNISAYCTCMAGSKGQYCKHRFNIINGSAKGVVSDNADEVALVASWIPGSDIGEAMEKVKEA